jgi:hypothetical protein
MTKDEALKLALEALKQIDEAMPFPVAKLAQKVIKEALAQPEHGWTPERIAGMARLKEAQDKKLAQPEQHQDWCASLTQMLMSMPPKPAPCNCKPKPEQPKVRTGNCLRVGVCASEGHKIAPQRTWVGLTDEEMQSIAFESADALSAVFVAEAKLKDKNNV